MQFVGWLVTLAILIIIAFQDFRNRSIHALLLIFLLGLGVFAMYSEISIVDSTILFSNFIFLALQALCIILVFRLLLQRKIFTNNGLIGLGDILFYLVCIVFFSELNFRVFYISSLFFALITHLFVFQKRWKLVSVPLAGYASLYLIAILLLSNYFDWNLYHDAKLISILESLYVR